MQRTLLFFFINLFFFYLNGQHTDVARIPQVERPVANLDLSINGVNYLHAHFPELTGKGLTYSLKELKADSLDLDLIGRYQYSTYSALTASTHATSMATIVGGRGVTNNFGQGVAEDVRLTPASFFRLSPEPVFYYLDNNISVQNHSYGLGIENFYGIEAQEYDKLVYEQEYLVQVFSAGNRGDSTSTSGPYAGISGFANLTGTFKMAKNVITLGALDRQFRLEAQSSRGPAYDGRIKPELVAYGEDGSSGAAAICSGVALMLQQLYKDQFSDQLPSAALVRATLLNSADDMMTTGPDFFTGYGNLNAIRAVTMMGEGHFFESAIQPGASSTFEVEVPQNTRQLKVMLAWTDPAAEVDATKALINDLDIKLITPTSDTILPWVLDARRSDLPQAAFRGLDTLNNQEQVTLEFPQSGRYTIVVTSNDLSEVQKFAVTYLTDSIDHFLWTFPANGQALNANETQSLKWQTTIDGDSAQLYYKPIQEADWIPVSENIDLEKKFLNWQSPSASGLYVLRMDINQQSFISDAFTLGEVPDLTLGFDCEEAYLLEWPSIEGIDQYQLFNFQDNDMHPVEVISQNQLVVDKGMYPSNLFTVAPIIAEGSTGPKSNILIPDFQSPGCYVQGLFITKGLDDALLRLELGTLFEVEKIVIEKLANASFEDIHTFELHGDLSLDFIDRSLTRGDNIYRARIALESGEILYSNEVGIFYVPTGEIVVFPNPVNQGDFMEIASPDFLDRRFTLYDARGTEILHFPLTAEFAILETATLSAGIYFYAVRNDNNEIEKRGKIVVK